MKLVRQSRAVRKNQLLASFLERQAEFAEAKTAYDSAYAKLKAEATRVLKLYVPLKNAVSDRNWSNKTIDKISVKKSGRVIELELYLSSRYGCEHVSYWEFPSWMIGSTDERIVEGLKQIIEEDGKRFARKEQERKQAQEDRIRAADLAKIEELKQKYGEDLNVVS